MFHAGVAASAGVTLLLGLGGCSDAGPGPAGPTASRDAALWDQSGGDASGTTGVSAGTCPTSLDELAAQVFAPACAGSSCHSAADQAAGLDLETRGTLETELLGVPSSLCPGETRVAPGDASSSLLVHKLDGTATCGEPMPPVGEPLAADTVACVATVVEQLGLGGCETCGGSACLDTTSDRLHCGGCGKACPDGATCVDSACRCPGGLEACGSGCVDTQSDGANCGSCGSDCGSAFCLNGSCAADCGALTACGNSCVDTQRDALHCGGCGVECGPGQLCEAAACRCAADTVSLSQDLQPLFTASCTSSGCHDGGTGSGPGGGRPGGGGSTSLDLTSGNARASLLATSTRCGALVVPGDPAASVLVGKLTGDQLCGGTQMPKGGDPWPQAYIDQLAAWICQGALDN